MATKKKITLKSRQESLNSKLQLKGRMRSSKTDDKWSEVEVELMKNFTFHLNLFDFHFHISLTTHIGTTLPPRQWFPRYHIIHYTHPLHSIYITTILISNRLWSISAPKSPGFFCCLHSSIHTHIFLYTIIKHFLQPSAFTQIFIELAISSFLYLHDFLTFLSLHFSPLTSDFKFVSPMCCLP